MPALKNMGLGFDRGQASGENGVENTHESANALLQLWVRVMYRTPRS